MRRLISALIIALFVVGGFPAPVYGAIATPTTMTINGVTFYQSVIETDDSLCIVEFTVEYATPPDEDIDEAFIVRVLNSGVEVEATAPFAFADAPDDGYSSGIVSFQFDPGDITWEAGTYSIELVGNPAQTWVAGDPPKTTESTINWETDASLVTSKVLLLAVQFEGDWSVDMYEVLAGAGKITTTYGEPYFTTVIANLTVIAPDVFTAITTVPEFRERDYTQTEAETAEGRWVGVAPFDLTDLATRLGMSRMWLTSFLFILFSAVAMILIARISESREPATFIFGAMLIIGAFSGFFDFEAAMMCGVLGALALLYTFTWRGAT